MPSVKSNSYWDSYPWIADGDEWQDQAAHCGQPYEEWKSALIDTYIRPYAHHTRAVEIGPGHGRWSTHILEAGATSLHLVDLSPRCLDWLAHRFIGQSVSTHVSAGSDLGVRDGTVDFIFSYDALVHCEQPEIVGYISAAAHALAPSGIVVLHTPGSGAVGGWRGDVDARQIQEALSAVGLAMIEQTDRWGPQRQYTCSLFGDVITVGRKPNA